MLSSMTDRFHDALMAPGRSPEVPAQHDLYGWLVGSWELDILRYKGAATPGLKGEVHFAWVLEGRAIEDIWIMPRLGDRRAALTKANNMYGVTFRVWDPSIEAWLIRWINPVTCHLEQQIGRRSGADIVQIGARADGTPTRWRYAEITADAFRGIGESLAPDGVTWRLEGEFRAKRI